MSEKKFLDQNGLNYFWEKIKSKFVSSFNNRTGAVMPEAGDYTAAMVGAGQQYYFSYSQTTSTKGWYRILKFNFQKTSNVSFLLNISHAYYSTGPGNITVLLVVDHYGPKITILQNIQHNNQTTIDDIRLVEKSSEETSIEYFLDMHYAFDTKNGMQVTCTPINFYAKSVKELVVAENFDKVDVLPEGETVITYAEWVNPPMALGVEYRTVERHNGNPIYAIAFDFGALPDTTTKSVAIPGWLTSNKLINYSVIAEVSTEFDPIPMGNGGAFAAYFWVSKSGRSFTIRTLKNLTNFTQCTVTLKYCKEE